MSDPQSTGPLSYDSAADSLLALATSDEETTEEQEESQPEEAENQPPEDEAEAETAEAEDEGETDTEESEESEDADPEDESEEEAPTFTVKVHGVEREVTLEELRSGYSRRADYDQKTAALAQERKAFEADRGAAVDEFRNKFEQLNTQIGTMTDEIAVIEQQVQAAEAEGDLDEANRLDRLARSKERQRNQAARVAQEQGATMKAEWTNREREKLLDLMPEWKDPEVYNEQGGKVAAYLQTFGVPSSAIGNASSLEIAIAHKAMLYDESQKAKPKKQEIVKKKVAGKPRVVKPGAASQKRGGKEDRIAEAKNHARQTRNIRDAARAVEEMFK